MRWYNWPHKSHRVGGWGFARPRQPPREGHSPIFLSFPPSFHISRIQNLNFHQTAYRKLRLHHLQPSNKMTSSTPANQLKSCLKRNLTQTNTEEGFMGHELRSYSLINYDYSQDDSMTQMINLSQTVQNTRYNTPYHHICSKDRLRYLNKQARQNEVEPLPVSDDMIDPLLRDLELTKYDKLLDPDAVR